MSKEKNKDRIKPILDKLGITPKDNWVTLHKFKKDEEPDKCYYYTFEHDNKTYCVSGDSISLVFSVENSKCFLPTFLYQGYKETELEEKIRKVIGKCKNQ